MLAKSPVNGFYSFVIACEKTDMVVVLDQEAFSQLSL